MRVRFAKDAVKLVDAFRAANEAFVDEVAKMKDGQEIDLDHLTALRMALERTFVAMKDAWVYFD